MLRHGFAVLLVCIFGCPKLSLATDQSDPERTHVLFIAIDDLRPELGCYGNKHIQSPHIDSLAKQGVTFTRAYCQQAVCNPSRVSVMTGLRPDTTQVWDLVTDFRTTIPDAITIPQHFRAHGFRAVSFGKIFHNTFPDQASWSEEHHWPRNSRLWSENARKDLAKHRRQMREQGQPENRIKRIRAVATEIVDYPESQHIDVAIAEQAIQAIEQMAASDQPNFLAVGFVRPHLPFVAPRKYWDLYQRSLIPLAENPDLPANMPLIAFGNRSLGGFYELRDYMDYSQAVSPLQGSLSEAQQRELKHGYYASVSLIDAQVGRLLAALDQHDLRDKTHIVLWGDHGWKLGEHNGWCKQTNFEIDTRVPLIFSSPATSATGQPCHAIVELVDIYPTLCDLAGIPVPDFLEGESLKPLLNSPDSSTGDAAVSQFRRRHQRREYMGFTIRTDHHRYIEWLDRVTGETTDRELYDHRIDPQENRNVAADPKFSADIARLAKTLWQRIPRPTARNPVPQSTPTQQPKPTQQSQPSPSQQQSQFSGRPNIIVFMADDWSWPHAGVYGDPAARTPTIDRLAHEGVLFENAFVSSPSCTPSRFAIATGQWHWRLGDAANLGGSLAANIPVYPELLETGGYRIGFSKKGAAPSKNRYRKRDPFGDRFQSLTAFLDTLPTGRPFCFWYGAGQPHRPYRSGTGKANGFDPESVTVPAGLPDHPVIRSDVCDYLDQVERFDTDVSKMLAELDRRGLSQNTIVIVAGDNGMPFPRCKATLYEMGTHVPLIVHAPGLVPGHRRIDDIVSLTDLAPTILELTGQRVPQVMTGSSLGNILKSNEQGQVDPTRRYTLTGMERHVFPQPSRAIRTQRFLFIRNFELDAWPTLATQDNLPRINYVEGNWLAEARAFPFNVDQSPTIELIFRHRSDPTLQPAFRLVSQSRPREELYQIKSDPACLKNLALDSNHRATRDALRRQLQLALQESGDWRSPDK